jgi:mannosyltransferase
VRVASLRPSPSWAVAALTVLAAALRFPALDAKGFWQDEAGTALLVGGSFDSILDGVEQTEGQPPLYFYVAWAWAEVFGTGEVGLRSLSALLGTLTVPVAYLAGRALVSLRTGVVAAALVAVNPLLVWYSQEARSYALLVFLCALSFLFFARALGAPATRVLAGWGAASALAVLTHYFAWILVGVEAGWLLLRYRRHRAVWVASSAVAAAVLLLVPVVLDQNTGNRAAFMRAIPLTRRVAEVPGLFLVGFETPYPFVVAGLAALLALAGLVLLARRAAPREQRGAVVAGVLGLAVVVLPVLAAAVGLDYYLYRNVLPGLVPLAVLLAAGYAARRAGISGLAAATAFCVLSVAVVAVTAAEPKYGREDWRTAAEALGAAPGGRAIVATPALSAGRPLVHYLPRSRRIGRGTARVSEIVLLGMAQRALGGWEEPEPPRPPPPPPPVRGFRLVESIEADKFTLFRFRAPRPMPVRLETLPRARIDSADAVVVLQTPAASGA